MPFIPSAALLSDANSSPCINVKDPPYTARGDGVTDDTAAIQAALTAAGVSSQTRTVCLPPGTYSTGILSVPAGVTLTGSRAATLKLKAAVNNNLLTLGDGAVVDGITIDGNRANQTISGAGVGATGAGCSVLNCAIAHCYTYGVLSSNVSGVIVEANDISDTRFQGIFIEASSVAIERIRVVGNNVDRSAEGAGIAGTGITVKGTVAFKVTKLLIEDNSVSMPTTGANTSICIEPFGGVDRARIVNNDTSGGSMGISMSTTTDSVASGNTIYNATLTGIELASATGCTVSDNTIDGNSSSDQGISASNTTPSRNVITGNKIKGCTSAGIQINAGDYTVITGNYIDQATGYALNILSTTRFTITGNVLNGNGTGTKGLVLDTSWDCAITGNSFYNFTQHGILLIATTAVTFDYIAIYACPFDTCNTPLGNSLSGGAALGIITVRGCAGLSATYGLDYIDYKNVIVEAWGSGTPESVVFGNKGSIFHRSDGGAATCFYVKEADGNSTSWVAK